MNSNQLLDCIGFIQDAYIASALRSIDPVSRRAVRSTHVLCKKRALLLAAAIAIALLLIGCGAAVLLNLQNMKMGNYSHKVTTDEIVTSLASPEVATGISPAPTEDTASIPMFSLQGLAGTPPFLAAKEYMDFEQSYDPDLSKLAAASKENYQTPEEYSAYNAYTQEMVAKIDEITQKYSLSLLGTSVLVQRGQEQSFYKGLGISSLLTSDASCIVSNEAGYFYPCGTFKLEFDIQMHLDDGQQTYWASMAYNNKKFFSTIATTIDAKSCTEWNYTLPDGTLALLILETTTSGYSGGSIYVDRPDAFLCIGVSNFDGNESMSKHTLEQIADSFDFSITPVAICEATAKEYQQENYAEWEEKWSKEMASNHKAMANSFTEELERRKLYPEYWFGLGQYADICYALYDVNGDSQDEMLLGDSSSLYEILFLLDDGKVESYSAISENIVLYLCEGGWIKEVNANKYNKFTCDNIEYPATTYRFMRFPKDNLWDSETYSLNITYAGTSLIYLPNAKTHWIKTNGYLGYPEAITESEYNQIMNSYSKVDIEMHPISEFLE